MGNSYPLIIYDIGKIGIKFHHEIRCLKHVGLVIAKNDFEKFHLSGSLILEIEHVSQKFQCRYKYLDLDLDEYGEGQYWRYHQMRGVRSRVG